VARGDYTAVRRQMDTLIADEMRRHDVTGLSIALVDSQQVVWAFGAGWADEQARRPADERTVYRMGSISKLFTDTAAMQLVQRGQLDLDAPLQQALPDFRIRSRFGNAPITPRQLMTHHAGLPRDVGYAMWGDAPPPFQQMVSGLADEDAPYPPGLQFDYSNVGVTVLGAALERVSGQRFEALVQRTLLDPLAMTTASFSSALPAVAPMSKAYRKGRPVAEPALRDVPAGGLNASVLDLAQFIKMVFAEGRSGGPGERQMLDPALLREMLRPQNADVPLDVGFHVGLGWMLSTLGGEPLEGGGPVAHHGGATVNFRSQLVLLPAHRLGVVVAANSASAGPVVNKLAQRALALALEAKTGIRQPEPAQTPPPAPAAWPEAELQALVGDYTTVAGFVRVVRHGSDLQAEVAGRTLQLIPAEHGELRVRYKLLGLLPIGLGELDRLTLQRRLVAGRDVLIARIGMQTLRVGERLPAAILPPALAAFAGTYVPETAPGEYAVVTQVQVRVEHDRLLARMTMRDEAEAPIQFVLQPLSDREAVVLGTLADAGEVIRLEPGGKGNGAVPTFRGSGYRWRRVGEGLR
jgi:CubicO group peptidase (beta-lactamase class C family)